MDGWKPHHQTEATSLYLQEIVQILRIVGDEVRDSASPGILLWQLAE
ncbi:hypothetical protein [Novipirellula aureliae]|nr:hypothetical protein [Novipirellula aureliae]